MVKRLIASLAVLSLATACTPFKPTGDFSDIRGRVFSRYFDSPLENATVTVPGYGKVARTDMDGYFEIRGLPTEWNKVEVSHPSHKGIDRQVLVEPYGTKYIEVHMDDRMRQARQAERVVFERNYDIWTTDIYGMQQENLTAKLPRDTFRTHPVWSNDKSKIGFIAFESTSRLALNDDGVWVMRSDGTMPRRVTSVQDSGRLYHLDWSQDGNLFMFMLQDKTFIYNQRYGSQQSITGTLTRPGVLDNYYVLPSWNPDGSQIATSAYTVDLAKNFSFDPFYRQIYLMESNGGRRRQLTTQGDNYDPIISHDGTKIAFVSTRTGFPEIWQMDYNGSNPEQLTFMKAQRVYHPRWSSNDQKILFNSSHLQRYKSLRPKELWVVDPLTGDTHMVSNDAMNADG